MDYRMTLAARQQMPRGIRYLGEQGGLEFIAGLPPADWRR